MLIEAGKKTGLLILSSGLMALSLGTYADNLDITFTANIRDTTCDPQPIVSVSPGRAER